jgi:hypothetical protein
MMVRTHKINTELADIRGDLKWLKGGMAVNTAIGIAVMLRVFLHRLPNAHHQWPKHGPGASLGPCPNTKSI